MPEGFASIGRPLPKTWGLDATRLLLTAGEEEKSRQTKKRGYNPRVSKGTTHNPLKKQGGCHTNSLIENPALRPQEYRGAIDLGDFLAPKAPSGELAGVVELCFQCFCGIYHGLAIIVACDF